MTDLKLISASHLCLESQILWTVEYILLQGNKLGDSAREMAKPVGMKSSRKLDQQSFIGGGRPTVPPPRTCNVDSRLQTKPVSTEPPLRQWKWVIRVREEPVTSPQKELQIQHGGQDNQSQSQRRCRVCAEGQMCQGCDSFLVSCHTQSMPAGSASCHTSPGKGEKTST